MTTDNSQLPSYSKGFKLFLLGFITLFLELALIRYLAGNIWNLGFFPNLVLLAVFVGMGAGFVFHHYIPDRFSSAVYALALFMLLILVAFVYYKHPMVPGFGKREGVIGGELYFTMTPVDAGKQSYIPFLFCFGCIVFIFALISQLSAKLFRQFSPLAAYSLNIAGSCAGILCFMLASWMKIPAWIWFIILALTFLVIVSDSRKALMISLIPAISTVYFTRAQDTKLLAHPAYTEKFEVIWSPYQKIEFIGGVIFVNGIGHQRMEPARDGNILLYQKPYAERLNSGTLPPYKSVLIIGAGAGNDVAAALLSGVEHVDAVEIDPVIVLLGKNYNALRPYHDHRVNLIVNDARAFMTRTSRLYDLIVFALTDSLVKVSPMAQLRLENYLFTEEAARKAFSLLTPTGDIIFYNFYRQPWLEDKMYIMISKATGKTPQIIHLEGLTMFKVGKLSSPQESTRIKNTELDIPTDDWPFLYLKKRGFPPLYRNAIIGMCVFVAGLFLVLIRSAPDRDRTGSIDINLIKLAFVFMGIAFMLLETKSVIQFSLLFGTTWLNSSLVFLAVLVLILAANWIALLSKGTVRELWLIYMLLLIFSLSTVVFPLGNLLGLKSEPMRFATASLLTFSPIFFANLIFSVTFRDVKIAEHIFGWNLFGATVGGVMEYTSMALGYNILAVIVAFCYTIVFILLLAAKRRQLKTAR